MNNLRKKALLLAAPFAAGFIFFYIIPYTSVFYYSFTTATMPARYAGFDNFEKVLSNEYFNLAITNTAVFTFVSIPILIVVSYAIANILYSYNYRVFRILLFIPVLIPSASITGIWTYLFGSSSVLSIYLLFVWKNIGLMCLIITSQLAKIPIEIHEAAMIDGANAFQRQKSIILPLSFPVLFFCTLVGLIQSFKIFREIYLIYEAYPPSGLYMIQHFIFNKFNKLDYAELSAGTLLFTIGIIVLNVVLLLIGNRLFIQKGKRIK